MLVGNLDKNRVQSSEYLTNMTVMLLWLMQITKDNIMMKGLSNKI